MGWAHCLTGTDTVGAEYNAEAGASVLVGVDSTPASVTTALAAISGGTLTGQVPGLALINAYNAAVDAVAAYGETAAASNVAFDTNEDGSVSFTEAQTALSTATTARALPANGGTATTTVLTANVTDATTELAAAKTAATAVTGGAAAIAAYDSAVAADTAATAALTANVAAKAAAEAGLNTSVTASGSTVTYATLSDAAGVATDFTTAAQVTAYLADSSNSAATRAALTTELNKVTTYGAEVVKAGALGLTAADAADTLTDATTALVAIDNASTTTVVEGQAYIDAQTDLATATTTLANAKTQDANVAAAKIVVDQYTALNKVAADANTAIGTFDTANTSVAITVLAGANVAGTGTTAAPIKDVFYFADKAVAASAASDFSITSFSTGDNIVLGNGLTYNSGALSTGNNNVSEFFLVQKGADTLVVLETAAYGSASVTGTAAGATTASPDAAVITLTGVTLDHVSVANGVISYV